MQTKPRWPLHVAQELAEWLACKLGGECARLEVAGSVRRGKPDVGDVELVYCPLVFRVCKPIPGDLFGDTVSEDHIPFDDALGELFACGKIAKRLSKDGLPTWGKQNKLAVWIEPGPWEGFPIDFFASTETSWFNYLVCRTGGAESNMRIAHAARAKGWKWEPYGPGFRDRDGNIQRAASEEDVFHLVGLPYLLPHERS